VVQQDDESQSSFYGKDVTFARVLQGDVNTPADAQPFISSVRSSFHEAREQNAAERP
jgi:lipid-binding SYLF domain-containing protein